MNAPERMNLRLIQVSVIPSISIFVRHSLDCRRKRDELYRNCRCPKHLRYTHDGKQHRQSAKTRTWSVAEQRRREIEDKFRVADPGKPMVAVSLQAESRPTIERAVQLFLTDKKSQGLDST